MARRAYRGRLTEIALRDRIIDEQDGMIALLRPFFGYAMKQVLLADNALKHLHAEKWSEISDSDLFNPKFLSTMIEYLHDATMAMERLHDRSNDLQSALRAKDRELEQIRGKQSSETLSDRLSEVEKAKFAEITASAKRTRKGKLIYSDAARKARKGFPAGILGRKVDDKYARELCKALKIH